MSNATLLLALLVVGPFVLGAIFQLRRLGLAGFALLLLGLALLIPVAHQVPALLGL